MRTSTKKRKEANDADYCRFKGWEVGTILDLLGATYRITAIGEEAILARRVNKGNEYAEVRWIRTLIKSEVVSARPVGFVLKNARVS